MHSETLTVTPDMAKEFLETSKVNPRFGDTKKYNKTVVSKYAADMKAGRWKLTHQGIAFNENGELIDGHNRLTAVILSGASVPMYVTYNAPNESVIIDRGWLRTTAQILKNVLHAGKDASSSNAISIAKLHMYFSGGESREKQREKTDYEIMEFILDHIDTLSMAMGFQNIKYNGKKLLRNASYGYAIFCALECGVTPDIIDDFSNIVSSGFCDNESKYAAILARNEMQQYGRSADQNLRAYQCKYIQSCLYDFEKGKKRTRRYQNPEAVYTKKFLSTVEKLADVMARILDKEAER